MNIAPHVTSAPIRNGVSYVIQKIHFLQKHFFFFFKLMFCEEFYLSENIMIQNGAFVIIAVRVKRCAEEKKSVEDLVRKCPGRHLDLPHKCLDRNLS